MRKVCPICGKLYTETSWRKTKAGGYRAFRHFRPWKVEWCRGAVGKHYAQLVILGPAR